MIIVKSSTNTLIEINLISKFSVAMKSVQRKILNKLKIMGERKRPEFVLCYQLAS